MSTEVLPQHEVARAKANRVRLYRADVKARIASGELAPDEVIVSDDDRLQGMKVVHVLTSLPGVRSVTAGRVLGQLGMTDRTTIGALSPARRGRLLIELRRSRRNPVTGRYSFVKR